VIVTTPTIDAKSLGKVGVLFGGRSAERDVSIMSGSGVLAALQSRGVDAHPFDPALRNIAELAAEKFDRVFIALHGRYARGRQPARRARQLGIAYTGSGVMACAIGMDKIYTKMIWLMKGLPTPKYAALDGAADLAAVVAGSACR
jgi:D-alanine-D-alanine ligase